ncbi:39197_t:CDS:2 [Gigaspora margarita]|uniref:39197_t:CDS:1 n=1 Tax=Gigaspora margarita TaxID=4874 RepID=A0ABN7VLG7_GIGMA|nr:39197_t:CDS:2 [Gigaspora margarita]
MSETKFSKLLPNHEKYHHNPIIYKTKSYTFWYTIHDKGVFPKSNLKYTRVSKHYAIPDNFSIITTWGKSSNLNTIKDHIKYIDNHPVYYINYRPNFELEIISNHSSSDTATKTQRAVNEFKRKSENSRILGPLLFGLYLKQIQKNRPQLNYIRPLKQFNELSISTKKAHARTIAKKIKKDFNQIAKKNYHPNNQVILKELFYTVANTPFQVEFGSQNIIEKNKHESAIVQIIDKYQISRDGYRALLAIQSNLPHVLSYLHPYLVANKILHSSKPVINLRISGDGHNVRKKINYIIITLAILNQKKELYLPDNHHTIVIYSDIEKYELLKSATQPLVDELNELQQSGFVNKNGINWLINLYFSSDCKFLALCLDINMANSINFCPWCQCKKTDLGNLKKQSWTIEKDMNLIASNYLAYSGHIRAPLFPMILLNHWKTTKWEYTSLLGPDKLKNKFDQLYCAIKNPDIDFTQFALGAKEWEAYFLQPDITNPNNQDIVEEGLYQSSDITLYIHVLVYHVLEFVLINPEWSSSVCSCLIELSIFLVVVDWGTSFQNYW